MSVKRSNIGWTDFSGGDANFVIGCTPISAGCKNCYARAIVERGGRDFSTVKRYPDKLARLAMANFEPGDRPFRRGLRPMVFIVDMGDLFHPDVSTVFIQRALDIMVNRPDVDWQILTKRTSRMAREIGIYLSEHRLAELPDHIWPGVTVEYSVYRHRLNNLRDIPSRRRFVSVEPMLEPQPFHSADLAGIAWVICGAESGPGRRSFDPWWATELYGQCRAADIPFFGKQASGYRPGTPLLIDGREIKEFPE